MDGVFSARRVDKLAGEFVDRCGDDLEAWVGLGESRLQAPDLSL